MNNIKKQYTNKDLEKLTNDLFHVLELLEPESKGKEIKINNNVLTISYNWKIGGGLTEKQKVQAKTEIAYNDQCIRKYFKPIQFLII